MRIRITWRAVDNFVINRLPNESCVAAQRLPQPFICNDPQGDIEVLVGRTPAPYPSRVVNGNFGNTAEVGTK